MTKAYCFKKYFPAEFVLEPDILKKIDYELNSFLTAQELSLPLEYRVVFKDCGYYITSSLEKVLAEPNSKGNRIFSLVISVGEERISLDKEKTPVFIECRFSKGDFMPYTCKVEIQDYRNGRSHQQFADDLCYLFEHTQRENSHNYFRVPPLLKGFILPFLTFFIILLWLRQFATVQGIRVGELSVVEFPLYILAIAIMFTLCVLIWQLLGLPKHIDKYLPTTGVFLWGAEIHDYRQRLLLRQNLIWGILVALVIGIVGSVIANRI